MARTSTKAAPKPVESTVEPIAETPEVKPAAKKQAVKVAKFSKVSYEQFVKDMTANGLVFDESFLRQVYDEIKLPTRATKGSAGYDICTPIAFDLRNLNADPHGFTFPTGLRCEMNNSYVMLIIPKSGLGFKHYSRLGNTVGCVDADYFVSDNEGDIMVNIRSDVPCNAPVHIEAGKAVCQALFMPYGVTDDDNTDGVRNGGFGSTGA